MARPILMPQVGQDLTEGKVVAIKVLKDEYRNDAEFLRRFEREARAVLHLSHENIVRAFDVGETDGLPYIVLEFVDGRTLKEIIDENGPMPSRPASTAARSCALNPARPFQSHSLRLV